MNRHRAFLVVVLLTVAGAVARTGTGRAAGPVNLSALPLAIGRWEGVDSPPPDEETLAVLRADATLHRTYANGQAGPTMLYAAYYASQRPGVSLHSPLHCLPGTGWEPLEVSTAPLGGAGSADGTMKRMLVRKGHERALVLYWYSIGRRMTGSEISSKLLLLANNATRQPRGAALVRIVVPVVASADAAERQATAFARELLPHWTRLVS